MMIILQSCLRISELTCRQAGTSATLAVRPTHTRPIGRYALTAALVLAVGVAARFIPRHWSPLPFNPDGFNFGTRAERIADTGQILFEFQPPQDIIFSTLVAQLHLVTDASVLPLLQPTIAIIGSIPALFAFGFVRHIGRTRNWPSRRILVGAGVSGLFLATEGLYLRRTAAVSYEVLGILLVVTSALAFHRLLTTNRSIWLGVLVPCLVALPITHHLSTMMAVLSLTALATVHLHQTPDRTTVVHALSVVCLFWLYFGGYYVLTNPPFYDDLAAKPGLFLGWVLVLPGLVLLFRAVSSRTLRLVFALPLAFGFSVLAINALTDVFPGTASTHPRVLLYVAPLAVLVAFAVWGAPIAFNHRGLGPVVLALFLGPVVFVYFALTAGLSPVYELFARRSQTFVHLSVVVMAAVAIIDLGWRGPPVLQSVLRPGLPAVLLVCALVSMPLAFAGPPVLPYESTTTTEEFRTVTFADAHIDTAWTSDDHLTRVARNYYGADASPRPTYEWLQGTTPPNCPVLVRGEWPSTGAQAYPDDPIPVDADNLDQFVKSHSTVYAGGNDASHSIVWPGSSPDCS